MKFSDFLPQKRPQPGWRVGYRIDQGMVRPNLEDRVLVVPDDSPVEKNGVFLVVDGVGGHAAGEVAAQIAKDTFQEYLHPTGDAPTEQRIQKAVRTTIERIREQARNNQAYGGMACVLTVAVLDEPHLIVGHIGDTRLYVGTVNPETGQTKLEQQTDDHTITGVLLKTEHITAEEARTHPQRNKILRLLGLEDPPENDDDLLDILHLTLNPDQLFLLCSDGLTDELHPDTIAEILHAHAGDPDKAAKILIDKANEAGGHDNLTVIVVTGEHYATTVERQARSKAPEPKSTNGGSRAGLLLSGLLGLLIGGALAHMFLPNRASPPVPPPNPGPHLMLAPTTDVLRQQLRKAQPGDVIRLAPGHYIGSFSIPPGVTLLSESLDSLNRATLLPGAADSVVVSIRAPGPVRRLIGLRILATDTTTYGLYIQDAAADLVHLHIEGFQKAGLLADGPHTTGYVAALQMPNNIKSIRLQNNAYPALAPALDTLNQPTSPAQPPD